MIFNDIPKTKKFKWCACDTETHTLIDNVIVSTSELNALALNDECGASYFREHATIDTYAWQISIGKYSAICSNMDEFFELFGRHNIGVGWFYNAKFDFSQIDYQILSNDKWKPYSKENIKAGYNCYECLRYRPKARPYNCFSKRIFQTNYKYELHLHYSLQDDRSPRNSYTY